MGATAAQGWYLFMFMIGFVLGPAGLFALGWLAALVGFGLMVAALVGFYGIKNAAESADGSSPALASARQRPVKTH